MSPGVLRPSGRSTHQINEAAMQHDAVSTERRLIRCDHCRKPLAQVVFRYFRMRFCSSDCQKAYQQRLSKITRAKIEFLDPSQTSEAA
jgi:hypothetical protein